MSQIVSVSAVLSMPVYVPSAMKLPGVAPSCGAAKAGAAKIEDTPSAEIEAPVRSAIRRCEVVMNVSPVLMPRPRTFWLRLEFPFPDGCKVGTQCTPPPGRDIPLIVAYARIPGKAKPK